MAHLNPATRELTCTAVYCGPSASGKSASLGWLGGRARGAGRFRSSWGGPDVLSLDLGAVSGFAVRFQVYAVAADTSLDTRQLMLNGADGIVFVADSQAIRFDENRAGLQALEGRLDPGLPLVMQYNKQDLPRELLLPVEQMAAALAPSRPGLPSDALHGAGVFETFTVLSNLVLARFA